MNTYKHTLIIQKKSHPSTGMVPAPTGAGASKKKGLVERGSLLLLDDDADADADAVAAADAATANAAMVATTVMVAIVIAVE